jgi:DnaJ-class molecular chaperone
MARPSATVDPYLELGIPPGASPEVIRAAFDRVVLECQPRGGPMKREAADRLIRAQRALALLQDPGHREPGDRAGTGVDLPLDDPSRRQPTTATRDSGGEARSDVGPPGVTVLVEVMLADVERGARRRLPVPCAACGGSGVPGPAGSSCDPCGGSGRAAGTDTVEIRIPRGVASGDVLPSLGYGHFRFVARLADDPRWVREGKDLHLIARIPYEVAVLGGVVALELPGRVFPLEVAAGTPSGHTYRLTGEGLPGRDAGRGDLVVTTHVAVPEQVGVLERWLLEFRVQRSASGSARGFASLLSRLQTRAGRAAARGWREWREQQNAFARAQLEDLTLELRSAAALVKESEVRLDPLLEEGVRALVPEANQARRRLLESGQRRGFSALSAFIVDVIIVAIVGTAVWIGGRYAAPAVAALDQQDWWHLLAAVPPASLTLVPILAGLVAGAVLAQKPRRWAQRLAGIASAVLALITAAAAGAASVAVSVHTLSGADSLATTFLTGALAIIVGLVPCLLFLLGTTTVYSALASIREAEQRRDRSVLRSYDSKAAQLLQQMVDFRRLMAEAHAVRPGLGSLLDRAADLAQEAGPPRSWRAAATALVGAVLLTGLWLASTAGAVSAVATLPAVAGSAWVRLAATATIAALCSLGLLLPPRVLRRYRLWASLAAATSALAGLSLAGLLNALMASPAPVPVYWVAGTAVVALILSFRLRDSGPATWRAARIAAAFTVAVLLWPVSRLRRAASPGGAAEVTHPPVPRF